MKGVDSKKRKRASQWIGWLVGVGVALALVTTLILGRQVVANLERQRTADSDHLQWTLTQAEVEYLAFLNALNREQLAPEPDLSDIRRRFDLLYSRIDLVASSRGMNELRRVPSFSDALTSVRTFLDESIPLIDGDDPALRMSLPDLSARAQGLRPSIREISLTGLAHIVQRTEERRGETQRTLQQLAIFSGLLFAALAGLSIYLLFANRQIHHRGNALEQANTRMNAILSTSLDGVIVSNAQGEVLEFNTAAEAIFGYSSQEAQGRPIGDLIVPPHLRAAHAAGVTRMQDGGARHVVGGGRVKLEGMRKSGEVFPIELALQTAWDGSSEIVIGFMRDISQRVANEKELITARDQALAGEKTKAEFLTVMSHEIRTPLNGLLGNLALLRNSRLDATQAQQIRNMEISGQLLQSHVDSVLDIASLEAGKLAIYCKPIDLNALLQEMIDSQGGNAASRGNAIDWQWVGTPHPWVSTDAARLRQILLNLVGNAIKFTENGKISLEVELSPTDVPNQFEGEFRVIDTGIGIADDDLERVFQDFVTIDASIGRSVGGTGLGLGIARRLAETLGGALGVESEPGAGSVFWLRLPFEAAEPALDMPSEQGDTQPAARLNILVVEDNQINLDVICSMLEADGHTVTTAMDGHAGVRTANENSFDAILMDISMPGMDGPTATRHIRDGRGLSSSAPVIAVSANVLPDAVETFRAAGMDAFVSKPISPTALRQALSSVAKKHTGESDAKPVDPPAFDMKAELGEAAYSKLLDRFLSETDAFVDQVKMDWETDPSAAVKACHKVAGSAAVFGAVAFREALNAIENAAKLGDLDAARRDLECLPGIWKDTKARLTQEASG